MKKGEKPKNWGARGAERWPEGTSYRVRGAIVRRDLYVSGGQASSGAARGALRAGTSATGARNETSGNLSS